MSALQKGKIYYSMGEVTEMFDVNPSLIRFWESKFDILKPHKNKKGNRLFTPADIENLKLIYHLVKEKGMTLSGAQKQLKADRAGLKRDLEVVDRLLGIKALLAEIKQELGVGTDFETDADQPFDIVEMGVASDPGTESDASAHSPGEEYGQGIELSEDVPIESVARGPEADEYIAPDHSAAGQDSPSPELSAGEEFLSPELPAEHDSFSTESSAGQDSLSPEPAALQDAHSENSPLQETPWVETQARQDIPYSEPATTGDLDPEPTAPNGTQEFAEPVYVSDPSQIYGADLSPDAQAQTEYDSYPAENRPEDYPEEFSTREDALPEDYAGDMTGLEKAPGHDFEQIQQIVAGNITEITGEDLPEDYIGELSQEIAEEAATAAEVREALAELEKSQQKKGPEVYEQTLF